MNPLTPLAAAAAFPAPAGAGHPTGGRTGGQPDGAEPGGDDVR